MNPTRRPLNFSDEAAAMMEAERLLAAGYDRCGTWSLGQVCEHVAKFIDCSLDGFPMRGPWLMRKVVGPAVLPLMLKRGTMPAGFRAPKEFLPADGLDDQAGVRKLRASFERFTSHRGELQPSPMLGRMTPGQWKRLHLIHAAHHLGFLTALK
jgi:hypothetical protein